MDVGVREGSLDLIVGRCVKVERLADNIHDVSPQCSIEWESARLKEHTSVTS